MTVIVIWMETVIAETILAVEMAVGLAIMKMNVHLKRIVLTVTTI